MRLVDPDSPPDSRRLPKLGILLLFFVAFFLLIGLAGVELGSGSGILFLSLTALLFATGVGLIVHAKWARWFAGGLFLLIAVGDLWEFRGHMSQQLPHMVWTLESSLWILNAALTSALFLWLSYRALRTLVDPERPPNKWTPRLIGLVLVVAGVAHLKAAFTMGGMMGGVSMQFSDGGLRLLGFRGWPLFHIAGVVVGLGLLVGNERIARVSTSGLLLLYCLLGPLAAWSAFDMFSERSFGLAIILFFLALPLVLVYLCWWLLHELGGAWSSLRTKDFRIGMAIVTALVIGVAVVGGPTMRASDSMEDQIRSRNKIKVQMREEQMKEAKKLRYADAEHLDTRRIPKNASWWCPNEVTEPDYRGRCSVRQGECEDLSRGVCETRSSVWCNSFEMSSGSGYHSYRCYISEDVCRRQRNLGTSRCALYPE